MNRRKLAPANIVILVAGVAMLVGSFLAFYKVPLPGNTVTFNAWDHGLFMVATLPALLGVIMALQIGLESFGNIVMPNRMLGFTWDQFHIVLSVQALLILLAYLVQARPTVVVVKLAFGAGYWLMLVGATALVLGALMRVAASRRRPHAL